MSVEEEERLVVDRPTPVRCLTCSDEAGAGLVDSVDGLEAVVAVGGGVERVAIDLVPDARPGDLLLCHVGIALERLEEAL